MARRIYIFGAIAALASCGGGSSNGDDAAVDGHAVDGHAIDAALPACPTSTVIAPGGASSTAGFGPMEITSSGNVTVFTDDDTGGLVGLSWNGSGWSSNLVDSPAGSVGPWGVTEIEGEPAFLANLQDQTAGSETLRMWLEQPDGSFALGEAIDPSHTVVTAPHGRFDPATHVLSLASDDNAHAVYSVERNSQGTWSQSLVASMPTVNDVRAAGIGTLTDNTLVIGVASSQGLDLYRRTGTQWALYRTLASTTDFVAGLWMPPPGNTAGHGIALYDDSNNHLFAERVSTRDGTASGAVDLLGVAGGVSYNSSAVFAPDGSGGKILVVDRQQHAWIVDFTDTAFLPAQELRPDLTFDGVPQLGYLPCAGFVILHATRLPADPPGSEPAVLDALSTFAPGL